nr:uncharacterized protein LOC115256725 [Aedes albopictus]
MAAEKKILLSSYSRMMDSIKSRAEKLLIFVRSFDSEKQDKSLLEDKLQSVNEMRSYFHETEVKLYGLLKEDEVEDWQMTSEGIEDTLDEIRHLIRSKLRDIDPPKPVSAQISSATSQGSHPKLPDIPLPRFSGQLEDWISFKNQFNALVKRREGLSESEKLFYLKAAIQDGAARHVQSSEDSFASLWKALCSEFENKRILVDKHIAQLFHVKPILRESGSALRNLLNDVTRNIRALANLELKLEPLSEQFLIHLVCTRLDARTRKDFELQLTDNALPSWDKLLDFLQSRCRCLENIEQDGKDTAPNQSSRLRPERSGSHVVRTFPENAYTQKPSFGNVTCFVCKGTHFLNRCDQFLNLAPNDRFAKIKSLGICLNCFSNKHYVHECKGSSCRKCGRRHHTLLHESDSNSSSSVRDVRQPPDSHPIQRSSTAPTPSSINSAISPVSPSTTRSHQYVLYTAVGLVEDAHGNSIECRILLDCGSMHNLIAARLVNVLKLPKTNANVNILGVTGSPQLIKDKVRATIRSTLAKASFNLEFLVMKKVTTDLPMKSFQINSDQIPADVALADPSFNRSRRIDMLLGIQVFNELFTGQSFSLTDDHTFWCKETIFGWVVGGAVSEQGAEQSSSNMCGVVTNEALSEQMSRFWETEAIPEPRKLTEDELSAERSFQETCRRLPDGRYEVGLPLKNSIDQLGESETMALRRFVQVERRLIHNPNVYEQYRAFMADYHDQGHMVKTNQMVEGAYFMPHHAVFNPASTTTKTRVVFDASATTTTGTSMNDHLFVGPVVQRKLADTDVPLEVYQLATVTYGTACAPFLATRVLKQLCEDESERFPLASKAGTEDYYMDDLLSGANTVEEAMVMQSEFVEMMSSGGFVLHKWASNHPALLQSVPNSDAEQIAFFEDEKTTRTLGLTWQPRNDVFLTKVHEIQFHTGQPTKRTVYSDIAKLFDPLGLLGPLIFAAKVKLQKLWHLEVDWDEALSTEETESWECFRNQIVQMGEISIPRCVLPYNSPNSIELHGFCDASDLGYGACAYIRSVDSNNDCSVLLLTSKSRIAPLKNAKMTTARLELCGALVLARLISNITQNLSITFSRITLWSDSTTALAWIRTDPSRLKTFVCNRVIDIQNLTHDMEWRYVNTLDNPADVLSRGLLPSEVKDCEQWWTGPPFLRETDTFWPNQPQNTPAEQLPETKNTTICLTVTDPPVQFRLFEIESEFRKMQRKMAWVLRFIDNVRKGHQKDHRYGELSVPELHQATVALTSIAQREAFPDDIQRLRSGKVIHHKSKLITYSVFVEKSRFSVLRVGGRIRHAAIPAAQKHPMVLPSGHPFTLALIRAYHVEMLHAPQQMLLTTLRRRFWVLHGRSTVRQVIRKCITCFRAKPISMQQQMGDLPKSRLEGVYPFFNTGVDFCGPIYIRQHNKRSTVTYKAYVAVFVCFATRAIHLELVGDLTADAFIAALHQAGRLLCQISNRMAGVRSAKYHLKRITGTANMNFEEYTTVLARIEALLNSRPITALSEDPSDMSPLTPGHFLVGRPLTDIAEPDLTDRKETTLSRWQRQSQMVQHFWARWSNDYITTLQNRNKWHKPFPVKPGQLVIIREDNQPPINWKMGRIEQVFPGLDGLVRVADVRSGCKLVRRPIAKLCLLPVDDNVVQPDDDLHEDENDSE